MAALTPGSEKSRFSPPGVNAAIFFAVFFRVTRDGVSEKVTSPRSPIFSYFYKIVERTEAVNSQACVGDETKPRYSIRPQRRMNSPVLPGIMKPSRNTTFPMG